MKIVAMPAQSQYDLNPAAYPINHLRNAAVDAVETSHLLMTDIDMWPNSDAYEALHERHREEQDK